MIILTPMLFLIAISNVLGIQYLLPTNRTKEFTASVTMGAIINTILNFILIPKYKAIGTCIATVIAEFGVTLVQCISVRKSIEKKIFIISSVKYIFSATIMFILVRFIGNYMGAKIITTIIQGTVGAITYIVILCFLKEKINFMIIRFLISKIKR